MARWLKNNTADPISIRGREILAGAYGEVPCNEYGAYASDLTLLQRIMDQEVQVSSDGGTIISGVDSQINFIKGTSLSPTDSDNAKIVRVKAAKQGWSFMAVPFEFQTSGTGTLFSKDVDQNTRTWITAKYYNAAGTEVTTPGLLGANEATIVRSVVDFEPTFDYEIVAGTLRALAVPQCDLRIWIVGAPDIPAGSGGSKEFAGGVNLRYMNAPEVFEIDGRVTKFMQYNGTYHTGKIRFDFRHEAGLKIWIMLLVEVYRE